MSQFDVDYVRSQFPALERRIAGRPVAYFDAPGGTQTPQRVLDAVVEYLVAHNANAHGFFATTEETDEVILEAHRDAADLLGCDWAEASFGANMTTLCFLLAEALARDLKAGDEILITELDHEANRGPWLRLQERGVLVREVPVDTATCTLDFEAFEYLVRPGRTKVVAVSYASNAVGTVSDVAAGRRWRARSAHSPSSTPCTTRCTARSTCARSAATSCCAPRTSSSARTSASVRARAGDGAPRAPASAHAGGRAAVQVRDRHAEPRGSRGRHGRHRLHRRHGRPSRGHRGRPAARRPQGPAPRGHRRHAGQRDLRAAPGAAASRGARRHPRRHALRAAGGPPRTSTVSFTIDGYRPEQACRVLGERAIFVWDGHFYAIRLVERLGLMERGGLISAGLAPYTTWDELERLVDGVRRPGHAPMTDVRLCLFGFGNVAREPCELLDATGARPAETTACASSSPAPARGAAASCPRTACRRRALARVGDGPAPPPRPAADLLNASAPTSSSNSP